ARNAPGGRDARTRPQFLYESVEHRKGPAPFEDPLGRLIVRRLSLVALFSGREFKRHDHTAAAFARALAVFLICHKEFQGSQNKGPEPSLLRVSAIEIAAFQHPDEELLCKILRLIGRITAPAQIGIQGIPVVLTQSNQSGPSLLRMWIAGGDHEGPSRRRKLGRSRQRVHGWTVRHDFVLAPSAKQDKELGAKGYSAIPTACHILLWHSSGSGDRGLRLSTAQGNRGRRPWPYRCSPPHAMPGLAEGARGRRWDR